MDDPSFFTRLSSGQFLIYNDTLYTSQTAPHGEDFINVARSQFPLVKGSPINSLERWDNSVRRSYWEEQLSAFMYNLNNLTDNNETLNEFQSKFLLAKFAIDEVIPLLVERNNVDEILAIINNDDLDSLAVPESTAEKMIQEKNLVELINRDFDDFETRLLNENEEQNQVIEGVSEFHSILSQVLGGRNIYVSNNQVYELCSRFNPKSQKGIIIKVNGKKYGIKHLFGSEVVEKAYNQFLFYDNKIRNFKEFKEQFRQTKLEELKFVKTIDMKNLDYREGNAGVKMINGKVFIYVTHESDYHLLNFHEGMSKRGHKYAHENDFSHYGPFQVGVEVSIDLHTKSISQSDKSLVFNEYSHPFLAYKDQAMQKLCMGEHYSLNTNGSLSVAGKVAQFLSDSRRILIHGYGSGAVPYHFPGFYVNEDYTDNTIGWKHRNVCSGICFEEKLRSLEEVKKSNIPVTNISESEARQFGLKPTLFL